MLEAPKKEIDVKDVNLAKRFQKEIGRIYQQDVDIHQHTRQHLGQYGQYISLLDEKYGISQVDKVSSEELENCIREILTYCNNDRKVKVALGNILTYERSQAGWIEAETQLNAALILVRAWTLAKAQGQEFLMYDNLQHNKATGGGCLAGICGRLVQPYSVFVTQYLEHENLKRLHGEGYEMLAASSSEPAILPAYNMSNAGLSFEEAMQRALDASVSLRDESVIDLGDASLQDDGMTAEEREMMEEAIRLSLSSI